MKAAHHRNPDIDVLRRIVALLLSMAGIARRASARSAPVRFLVHFFLIRAEAAVLTLFGVPADEAGSATPVLPGPSDLLFLSARLRALALLLARTCGMGLWADEERPVSTTVPAVLAILPLPRLVVAFHDTS